MRIAEHEILANVASDPGPSQQDDGAGGGGAGDGRAVTAGESVGIESAMVRLSHALEALRGA